MKHICQKLFVVLLLVLLSFTNNISAQNDEAFETILGKLSTYSSLNSPEKIYVQTDKDFYTNGETIWFRTYILNGISHIISDKSRVVYLELIDSEGGLVDQRKIYTGFEGGSGDIALANDIKEGVYMLRAYTKYMLNEKESFIFRKTIPIWNQQLDSNNPSRKNVGISNRNLAVATESPYSKNLKPVVQFFPEGGNLVAGMESVLGLKITDSKGKGLALEGKIFDQNDSLVAMFRSYEFGLGRVPLKAEIDTDYYAEIEIDGRKERYQIPEPLLKGYVLQISNKGDYLEIRASSNIANGLAGSLILGHLRGDLIVRHFQEDKVGEDVNIKLFTSELDDGIASFTLFAPNGEPVCERLVFIDNPENSIEFSLKTDQPNYGLRNEVTIDLTLADKIDSPLRGNFSMSVATQEAIEKETQNIKSWLLLNSDLGGAVENPGYFFEEQSQSRKNLLDMLMLTHGWRRFVWKEFTTNTITKKSEFLPEKGILIQGSTTSYKNQFQPKQSLVKLTVGEAIYEEEKGTNAQGKFSIGPIVFLDSLKAEIYARSTTENNEGLAIYLDASFPTVAFTDSDEIRAPQKKPSHVQPYLGSAYRKKVSDFEYDAKVTKLKEVVVKAEPKTQREGIEEILNERTLYGAAQTRLYTDSIPNSEFGSIFDLLYRVPGVWVKGVFPNQSVEIRNIGSFSAPTEPLYLLDGIPVEQDLIQSISTFDVLFVDVLKTPGETAQYGSRGATGVVAVYTRRGDNFEIHQERQPNRATAIIPGFYKTREFYAPNYALPKSEDPKPDYRTTLHWEPSIRIDGEEQDTIRFFTGDANGTYLIRVEGITDDGRPVSGTHTFTVSDTGD